ncbi:MAG: ABC transporter ATP-binding protein, partial [Herpetosiphonaceae bacterium]|nr:ABC transporter ATP-binding protein [Herpetosiphonaceae bacterium]
MQQRQRRSANLLVDYLRPQRRKVGLLAVVLLSSIGLQLVNPQLLRRFIDSAMQGGTTQQLTGLALLFIAIACGTQALGVAATCFSEQVGWAATNRMRSELARHCLNLDMPFHQERTPGELIERIDGDVTALANFFSQFVIRVLGNGLLLAGVLILLFREDWRVGAAMLLFTLLAIAVLRRSRNLSVPYVAAEREADAQLYGFLEERLSGIDDIRANGGGAYVMRRFFERSREILVRGRASSLMNILIWAMTISVFALGYALALALGAYLFMRHEVTLGTVFLFFQYTQMLRQPLEQLTEQLRDLQRASASIGRIEELRRITTTMVDGDGALIPAGALTVGFEDVVFGYGEHEPVLKQLSFELAPGKVLGLLGRTGSGKTTLTRLLFRLYDPQSGTIHLNDTDLRTAYMADVRQRVGIVTQDVQLFNASVRDNLSFFDRSISDERLQAVLETIGLWNWCQSLPAGLDCELALGGGVSAGEAQLLAFARVFLHNPG